MTATTFVPNFKARRLFCATSMNNVVTIVNIVLKIRQRTFIYYCTICSNPSNFELLSTRSFSCETGSTVLKKKTAFQSLFLCCTRIKHHLTIYFFQLFSKFEFEKCNRRVRHTFPTTHEGFSRHQCQLIPSHLGSRKKWTNAGCHQS